MTNEIVYIKNIQHGTSLAVQWLRLRVSNAGGTGSIPGWGTNLPHALWCGVAKKWGKKKSIQHDDLTYVYFVK